MEIALKDVMPYIISAWTILALALMFRVYYRVWKLKIPLAETKDTVKEYNRICGNYAVTLFCGASVYGAGLCILVYIVAPIKQTEVLVRLLIFFAVGFFMIARNYQSKKNLTA